MELIQVLRESINMLRAEPKLFVPRLGTTLLYTLFILKSAQVIVKATTGSAGIWDLLALIFFSILLLAVDILVYGMYSSLAEQFKRSRVVSLRIALSSALSRGKTLLLLGFTAIVFLSVAIILITLSAVLAVVLQRVELIILSFLFIVVALLLFAFVFFFAVPSAVIEELGWVEALSRSVTLGRENAGLVLKLNIFFGFLVLLTLYIATVTEMKGKAFELAIIFFILARLVQVLVYTYISVATPTAFLLVRSENG